MFQLKKDRSSARPVANSVRLLLLILRHLCQPTHLPRRYPHRALSRHSRSLPIDLSARSNRPWWLFSSRPPHAFPPPPNATQKQCRNPKSWNARAISLSKRNRAKESATNKFCQSHHRKQIIYHSMNLTIL